MRLNRFLNEEDIIQKGLDTNEPEVNKKYSDRVIKSNKKTINKAISKLGKPSNDADEAILSDLEDKLDKWENVKKETKPAGPFTEKEPEEKDPPEEPEEKDPPEEPEEKDPPEEPEEKEPKEDEEDDEEKKEEKK